MKSCSSCRTENADANKFCQQCGRPLDADVAGRRHRPLDRRPARAARLGPVPAVPVEKLFAAKARIVIGRGADCDVVLPHPLVSRYHALLERRPDGLRLSDLSSVNGVFVAGRRITDPVLVKEGEQVGIGPFLFSLRQGVIHSLDNGRSLRLEARGLEKAVAGRPRPDAQAARRHQPGRPARRVRQPAGAERLRQEHAHGLPQRPPPRHRRQGAGQRRGFLSPLRQLPPVARLRPAEGHRPHTASPSSAPSTTPPGCACRPTPARDELRHRIESV